MREHRRNNVTEAEQEVPSESGEHASHIAEALTDASEAESAGTEILQPKVDSVTEIVQEAEGTEEASHITETSRDVGERAARVGTEIFQCNVDTVREALQSSAELTARLAQHSADQFGRVFGIRLDGDKALQNSSNNLDTIIQSTSILAEVSQKFLREWMNFTRERMEQNFNRFESLCAAAPPRTSPQSRANFCAIIWRVSFSALAGSPRYRCMWPTKQTSGRPKR